MKKTIATLAATALTFCSYAESDKYLDNFYAPEIQLFGTADASQQLESDLKQRLAVPEYFKNAYQRDQHPAFSHDFSDKKNGDFSIVYTPSKVARGSQFGFMTNLWGLYNELDENYSVKFSLKTENLAKVQTSWKVQIVDSKDNVATTTLEGINTKGKWGKFVLPLKNLKKSEKFDLNTIKLCLFEAPKFAKDAKIKFDFIRFDNGEKVIGITDKTITQIIAEQKATKQTRINRAFEASAKKAHHPMVSAFALLYLNKDLAKANKLVRESLIGWGKTNPWGLWETQVICRTYLLFSNRCGKFKGRLEPETETLLLKTLWDRTVLKNDIHWARQSTWWMDGSENHDLSAKANNLVSSRIFMNEPEYKDRVYPDYGFGGGYHYGRAGYYGKGIDANSRHGGGRAHLSDGKKYNAEDHYKAWTKFLKEYFRERAKHGFFMERHSYIYSKHTMNMVDLIYAYGGDKELSKIVGNFMTLYWADWVQAGAAGITGGPKTRFHKRAVGAECNRGMIEFLLGGPANTGIWNYWNNINDYELPELVQLMALDREGMNNFVYQSRGIGEEIGTQPRPKGLERSTAINPNSRFLKYVYVTPLYTLGTQMDHPQAIHSHLSKAGRWHGMTLTADNNAKIVPVSFPTEADYRGKTDPVSLEVMNRSLQSKNTLIVQRSRGYTAIHPDWYPQYKQRTEMGVYLGKSWDEKIEQDGWIFLRKGDVYAAVKVILRDQKFEDEKKKKQSKGTQILFHSHEDDPTVKMLDKPYSWIRNNEYIKFNNRFSPVIIQAGDKNQFVNFSNFMKEVAQSDCQLYKTVVPTFNILTFTPPDKDASEMEFNAANTAIPTVDGKAINYEYPMTFDSPYIKSKYGSGIIDIQYDGKKLKLDFNESLWNKLF
ncbi:hypothetical protein PQO01_10170 [Lentisphaera marina]|uniref:hypothetical protein n=1 Tax=Lentisphaera marina TaxID=1111041 RepID=UPI0023655A34|nr:hypothetical protein [Lentisphaera marina]MDD7985317.1 hypothetical protein [Lentisphaera marina]